MAKIKIIDIARMVGLSPSTVSFVLNGKGDEMHISKLTQEKIIRLATEMGYVCAGIKQTADVSGEESPYSLNLFISRSTSALIKREILSSVNTALIDSGTDIRLIPVLFNDDEFENLLVSGVSECVSGNIFFGLNKKQISALEKSRTKTPTLLFNCRSDLFNYICLDSFETGRSIYDSLSADGCGRVIFLISDGYIHEMSKILEGYNSISGQTGAVPEIAHCRGTSYESGVRYAKELFERGDLPDAIISNDKIAVGIAHEFGKYNIDMKNNLRLFGIGDLGYLKYTNIPISHSFLPLKKMYNRAAEVIVGQIKNINDTNIQELFKPTVSHYGNFKEIASSRDNK